MINYTPGPWNEAYIKQVFRHARGNPIIAGVDDDDLYKDETLNCPDDSDSHLIAAAPELLEALYFLVQRIEQGKNFNAELCDARAAIAKAGGL